MRVKSEDFWIGNRIIANGRRWPTLEFSDGDWVFLSIFSSDLTGVILELEKGDRNAEELAAEYKLGVGRGCP